MRNLLAMTMLAGLTAYGPSGVTEAGAAELKVVASFSIDPFRRDCLLNGLDDIGLTLTLESEIQAFEEARGS